MGMELRDLERLVSMKRFGANGQFKTLGLGRRKRVSSS
jgi:hypothetical protein